MSRPVSALKLGAFMLAGLALLVAALLVFGRGEFFRPKVHAVVFFDDSLNGLNRGSPVKVRGVQVGTVRDIVLQLDDRTDRVSGRILRPVVLEIDPRTIVDTHGEPLSAGLTEAGRREELERQVADGLRARLEIQSILTGLLYVDLSFQPGTTPDLKNVDYQNLAEIPSLPSTVEEVKASVEELARRIRNMPLEAMVNNIAATLTDIRTIVASEETRRTREALARSMAEAQGLLSELNRELPSLIRQAKVAAGHADQAFQDASRTLRTADQTLAKAGVTAQEAGQTAREATAAIRDIRNETRPVLTAAEQALNKATAALDATKAAMENVAAGTDADSNLEQTLAELQNASRSMRVLTDYLQRHPDSLIFGRSNR